MVAGDVARVIRAPGRLVAGPTNLSLAYPYGGTEVGKTRMVALTPVGENFRVLSEGLGEVTDVLEMSNRYVFSCVARGWDDDAVEQFFGDNYTAGSVSGHALFSVPGSVVPGASGLTRAIKWLYVPDDPINVDAVIIYRGVPDWQEGTEIIMGREEEVLMPVAIECVRDTSDRILVVGRLADLSL